MISGTVKDNIDYINRKESACKVAFLLNVCYYTFEFKGTLIK